MISAPRPRVLDGARARQIDWQHPEWWIVPVVGAAWLALVALAVAGAAAPGGAPGPAYGPLLVCPIVPAIGGSGGGFGALLASVGEAGLMVVAMMGPLLVPTLHRVGLASLWARRRRGPALVFAGFVTTWLPVVVLFDATVTLGAGALGSVAAIAVATALAVAWQVTAWKWRALRRCARPTPIPTAGWRADVGSLRRGFAVGRSCIGACGGFMLVAAAAGHGIVALALLAAVQLWERMARRPGPWPGGLAVVGVGALAAVAALVQ